MRVVDRRSSAPRSLSSSACFFTKFRSSGSSRFATVRTASSPLPTVRCRGGRAAPLAYAGGDGQPAARPLGWVRAGGALRLSDARSGERAADGAQLLLGRSQGAPLAALLGGRMESGGRPLAPLPGRGGAVSGDGRDRGVGDGGDADAGRRRCGDTGAAGRPSGLE